jgi:hypothetical protein
MASLGDIARPDDHFDQYPARILRFHRAAHGPRDSDATPKK